MLATSHRLTHTAARLDEGRDLVANIVPRCFEEVVRNLSDDLAIRLLDDILAYERTSRVSVAVQEMLDRAACFADAERIAARLDAMA